jgi:hypothetical protein
MIFIILKETFFLKVQVQNVIMLKFIGCFAEHWERICLEFNATSYEHGGIVKWNIFFKHKCRMLLCQLVHFEK